VAACGPTLTVKSTLVASSRQGLFQQGHQAAYERALGAEGARRIQEAAMGNQWLPVELARLHYQAADAIGLDVDEMHAVGNVVGARIEGALMGSLARIARAGGVTPWTPLGRLDQLWFRMYQGGSIAVFELGPKDARIEITHNELADIRYWRVALTGLVHGAGKIFARTMHTNLVDEGRAPGTCVYTMSWV
jgi:hypothetical protein